MAGPPLFIYIYGGGDKDVTFEKNRRLFVPREI
jgi:hypothetical protein